MRKSRTSARPVLRLLLPAALLLLPLFGVSRMQRPQEDSLPLFVNSNIRMSRAPQEPAEALGDFDSLRIPMKRAGRLFLIEAVIGGQRGNFVFDTGAAALVLNRTYFRQGVAPAAEPAGGATGGFAQVGRMRVDRLDLGGLWFEQIEADVIPLGHIEDRRGVRILGLLGMKLFRELEMVVDLRNGELVLYRTDRFGNRRATPASTVEYDITAPLRESGGVAFTQATVGGRTLDFCLDTGAEANVVSSSAPKKALETILITRRSELTGSGSQAADVLFGTMNDFYLNGKPMHPMQTMITPLNALAASYDFPLSGILGYDFFQKGRVCLNLAKKELGIRLFREEAQ